MAEFSLPLDYKNTQLIANPILPLFHNISKIKGSQWCFCALYTKCLAQLITFEMLWSLSLSFCTSVLHYAITGTNLASIEIACTQAVLFPAENLKGSQELLIKASDKYLSWKIYHFAVLNLNWHEIPHRKLMWNLACPQEVLKKKKKTACTIRKLTWTDRQADGHS